MSCEDSWSPGSRNRPEEIYNSKRERESLVSFATLHVLEIVMNYLIYLTGQTKYEIKYDWHCHSSIVQCAAHGLVVSLLVAKTRVEKLSMMKAAVLLCGRCRLRSKSQMLSGRHPCRCRMV